MTRLSLFRSALSLILALGIATAAGAAEHQVAVRNFEFDPQDLVIEVGDTVTWTNEGGLHNVNAPGFFRCAEGCDGEGGNGDPSDALWSFSLTFDDPADIPYGCEVHLGLGMVGSLTVVAGGELMLEIQGECPGEIRARVTGGTPNGNAGLMFGSAEGSDPIPGGPCGGMDSGLSDPKPLAPLPLDDQGIASLTANVGAAACGVPIQAVDASSCDTSNVTPVPGGARDTEKGSLRSIHRKRRR